MNAATGDPSCAESGAPITRKAGPAEAFRARHLFESEATKPPGDAEFLLMLRERPVERIAAALAIWRRGDDLEFLPARLPGVGAAQTAAALLPELEKLAPAFREIRTGRLLAPDEEWAPFLEHAGYARTRTERVFEADFTAVWRRIDRLFRRHSGSFPKTWRLEPIAWHEPETAWPLVSAHRLVSLADLRLLWNLSPPEGYRRDWSPILFDGDEPIAAFLVRSGRGCLAVDIRVVKPIHAKSRALANIALMGFILERSAPDSLRIVAFRGDESAHRETANLAFRLGGREVGQRHVFARQRHGDAPPRNDNTAKTS